MSAKNARLKRRACTHKKRYPDYGYAVAVMRRVISMNASRGIKSVLHVYRCPHCGSYHIGHVSARRARKIIWCLR